MVFSRILTLSLYIQFIFGLANNFMFGIAVKVVNQSNTMSVESCSFFSMFLPLKHRHVTLPGQDFIWKWPDDVEISSQMLRDVIRSMNSYLIFCQRSFRPSKGLIQGRSSV